MTAAGPRQGAGSYLLVSQALVRPVDGDRTGWRLLGYRDGLQCFSTSLAGHGAPVTATVATAQAVADRVLAGHGVTTTGSHALDGLDDYAAYSADAPTAPARRGGSAPARAPASTPSGPAPDQTGS